MEKSGPRLTIRVNEKVIVQHIDEIPFYSNFQELDRFGLTVSGRETFTHLKIETRQSAYDYEKMMGFKKY